MKKGILNLLKKTVALETWGRLLRWGRIKRMTVVDHEPWMWFLVRDGKRLLLDVACNHSYVGYSWLIELQQDEVARYETEGREYISELAHQVHYSAPILKGTLSPYRNRKLGKWQEGAVHDAVMKWRSELSPVEAGDG